MLWGWFCPPPAASKPFMPPAFAWALLCLQDCALVSVRPLHPSAPLLSPVLCGGLAPFPPFLPHFFPHHCPAPRCPTSHPYLHPFTLLLFAASAISLPPEIFLDNSNPHSLMGQSYDVRKKMSQISWANHKFHRWKNRPEMTKTGPRSPSETGAVGTRAVSSA